MAAGIIGYPNFRLRGHYFALAMLASKGVTIAIIEHTMQATARLADRLVVLDHGKLTASGPPDAVIRDEQVIEACLGEKWTALCARG